MTRRVFVTVASLTILGSLAGCGVYEHAQRPAWRTQAENTCLAQHRITPSEYIQPANEMSGPGICGLTRPFKVTALQNGAVAFNSTATLDCSMIAELDQWLADVVQPAAQARFGVAVVQINSMGSYSCRGMNNQYGAQLSEHSFGNALDIGGFVLADGRTVAIVRDWTRGDEQTQAFLRDVHGGACDHFTTVLGPGSNVYHYNHIHVDLAMHGNASTGARRICKPVPKTTVPAPRRDDLPDAPEIDDEIDMAQARPAASAMYAMHSGPSAAVPAQREQLQAFDADEISKLIARTKQPVDLRHSTASAYAPPLPMRAVRAGAMGSDGVFVPEGSPSDWDITSRIPRR
ncbi:MAG: extensin family protein [Methylobacteriaceae bacterium]|nr:extensin family protein [Methylobacteriaceae bacterium]